MVWAHSNYLEDGKGKGVKADDIFGCYACDNCHAVLDGRKPSLDHDDLRDRFHRAMKESIRRLLDKGIIS